MYPLKFEPILKQTLWGGDKIIPFKHLNSDLKGVGESWEISGVENNESVVANGPDKGLTLADMVRKYREELVGEANYARFGNKFPLLIKFIDAKQDLSIQVHPTDELAKKRHNSMGKTEMWYVVGADEGAHLMSGLSKQITPDEYAAKVEDHTITDVLRDYRVSPGDVFFLPAGRIHSIGAGSFIAEIQQTSDITYRIYDFGRLGLDGKPRELHTELSKAAIDYTVLPDYRTAYTREKNKECLLVDCAYFTTSLLDIDKPFSKDLSSLDSFLILICTAGKATVKDTEGHTESIRRGETILIPADTAGIEIMPEESAVLLTTYIR